MASILQSSANNRSASSLSKSSASSSSSSTVSIDGTGRGYLLRNLKSKLGFSKAANVAVPTSVEGNDGGDALESLGDHIAQVNIHGHLAREQLPVPRTRKASTASTVPASESQSAESDGGLPALRRPSQLPSLTRHRTLSVATGSASAIPVSRRRTSSISTTYATDTSPAGFGRRATSTSINTRLFDATQQPKRITSQHGHRKASFPMLQSPGLEGLLSSSQADDVSLSQDSHSIQILSWADAVIQPDTSSISASPELVAMRRELESAHKQIEQLQHALNGVNNKFAQQDTALLQQQTESSALKAHKAKAQHFAKVIAAQNASSVALTGWQSLSRDVSIEKHATQMDIITLQIINQHLCILQRQLP